MATTTTKRRKSRPRASTPKAVRTIAAAATALGVHQRTLKEWLSRGAPGSPGKYDVEAIAAWRAATLRPSDTPAQDLAELRRRQIEIQVGREELKFAREKRELIEVSRATAIIAQHAAEVRAHLDQFPDLVVSLVKVEPKEKKSLLTRLREKVRELCEGFESSAKELAEAAKRKK